MRERLCSYGGLCSAMLVLLTGLSLVATTGCDNSTAKTCIEKGPELAGMCQAPGSEWKLLADGTEECGLNGVYQPKMGNGGGGSCNAEGACSFSCTVSVAVCPYGLSYITREEYACSKDAGESCMDGETQCVNGRVSRCDGAQWSAPEDCPGGRICERDGTSDVYTCVAGILWSEIEADARGSNRNGEGPNDQGRAESISPGNTCRGDCNSGSGQTFNQESCRCECSEGSCGEGRSCDGESGECVCQAQFCTAGRTVNEENCRCECSEGSCPEGNFCDGESGTCVEAG